MLEEEEETHLGEDHQVEEASEAFLQQVHQEAEDHQGVPHQQDHQEAALPLQEEEEMANSEETHQMNLMGIAPKPTPSETSSTSIASPISMQNK